MLFPRVPRVIGLWKTKELNIATDSKEPLKRPGLFGCKLGYRVRGS